ncbi:hypothetical protein QYF36_006941 [Acer negundo]|nr:hypothetical protein QYF36_006941 [Acer negundo]
MLCLKFVAVLVNSLAKRILEKMANRNITDCDSWNIPIRWLCENMEFRKANELLVFLVIEACLRIKYSTKRFYKWPKLLLLRVLK